MSADNYFNLHVNFSIFEEKFMIAKSCMVPFCIPHVNRLNGNFLTHKKFDKWVKLPKSAHKLYWVLHQNEYERLHKRYVTA
jgi:hypothetical protein